MTAAARRPPPLAPEWIPFEIAFEQTHLWRWVILSVLLHVLAILLFGAPSGGSREGRAMWGSLQVMLQRRIEPPPPPPPASEPVPEAPRAPMSRELPLDTPRIESFPPLLDRLPGLEPLPAIVPLVVPPPTEVQVIPVPPPAPKPAAAPEPQPEASPPVPIPSPLLQPVQPMIEAPRLPAIERAPDIRIPAEAPPIPAPLLQPLPQVPERAVLPPIERAPTLQAPALPTPGAPVAPAPAAPAEVVRPETPRPEAARPETVRPEAVRPEVIRPEAARPETIRPEAARPDARPAPERAPAATPPAAPAPAESPFRQREEPSSNYDPTKPSIDPDAARRRAGELARQGVGQRAPLAFPLPPVEKPKSKLESAIENARKPDCRDAYKGLGLLAAVPLIANEFGEGTCRW